MLGSYNGKVEAVKNGDWMKIGVEAPEETNSRRASKIAGVNGPSMSKPARPQHIYRALAQDTQPGRQKAVTKSW